ncbi:MAG: glycosyltransferase family 2 protein [Promethearchaeota archaeon]
MTLVNNKNLGKSTHNQWKINTLTPKDQRTISIVLPCYNEEKTIGKVLQKIENLNLENYEIIVVDDGSTDRSAEIVKQFKNTKLIVHKKNKGYGRTLLDGIEHASGDIIVTIDSDGQHDPNDIPYLIKPILENRSDIVVGSRYKGHYYYEIPLTNRTGEALIEAILRIFFGVNVKNNQGGFRVFHRKTLNLFKESKFHDMAFTTEILMLSSIKGFKIKESPINLKDREVGKSRVKKVRLLRDLVKSFGYYFVKKLLSLATNKYPRFLREINKPFIKRIIIFLKKTWFSLR